MICLQAWTVIVLLPEAATTTITEVAAAGSVHTNLLATSPSIVYGETATFV
jgi:hypothetical protein